MIEEIFFWATIAMAARPALEQAIYIDNVHRGNHYHYDMGNGSISERRPLYPQEVWIDLALIAAVPPPQTPAPGTLSGVVRGISGVALAPVPGSDRLFEAPLGTFLDMIPANYAGGAYRPTLTDAALKRVPYNPSVWIADGVLRRVEFLDASPVELGYSLPLSLDYWRYVGAIAGSGSVAPGGLWQRGPDPVAPAQIDISLAPAPATSALDTVVFPASSTEFQGGVPAETKFFLDGSSGAIRGGGVTGTAWDVAQRGAFSVAFGQDGVASGVGSTVAGGQNSTAAANMATVGGGQGNAANGTSSTIAGGDSNTANGTESFVGGGRLNTAGADGSAIGGGNSNITGGDASFIGGGNDNFANETCAVVGGGKSNTAAGDSSTVAGGINNAASGILRSTVGGGEGNTASANYSVVAGGANNAASGEYSIAAGGQLNAASGELSCVVGGGGLAAGEGNTSAGLCSFVGGGRRNTAVGEFSTVGGGERNYADGLHSAISGGLNNLSNSTACAIGGGLSNTVSGAMATIAGGQLNLASGISSNVSGGMSNHAFGPNSHVGGGSNNTASGPMATVVAGDSNTASDDMSFVGCGQGNSVGAGAGTATAAVLVGGISNRIGITSTSLYAFIGCGSNGVVDGNNSAVVGGNNNVVSGALASIVGGESNAATESISFVGGGKGNLAGAGRSDSEGAAIVGGLSNQIAPSASAPYSFIGGGRGNLVDAAEASIVGGSSNYVAADGSFVGGGNGNQVGAGGSYSAIGGGSNNRSTAVQAFVGAGDSNSVGGSFAAGGVVAGVSNSVQGDNCVIGAGVSNQCSGTSNGILGGRQNAISTPGGAAETTGAAVVCGVSNSITAGCYHTVLNGFNNVISTTNTNAPYTSSSVAAGLNCSCSTNNTFMWNDGGSAGTAPLNSVNPRTFLARATNGFFFYTGNATANGATLAAGSSAWAAVSDRAAKENIEELDSAAALAKVRNLPIYQYNYKGTEPGQIYRGPMAQDWHAAFPSEKDPLTIDTMDLDGVTLAAVKGLAERNHHLEERVVALEALIASLIGKQAPREV